MSIVGITIHTRHRHCPYRDGSHTQGPHDKQVRHLQHELPHSLHKHPAPLQRMGWAWGHAGFRHHGSGIRLFYGLYGLCCTNLLMAGGSPTPDRLIL
jgi:hypothetical protein